jgi:hypothetical protein
VGAAQVVGPQDTIKAQLSDGAAGGDKVLISGTVAATGVVAHAVVGGGSLAPEVLLEGDMNVTVEEVATSDPGSSTGPARSGSSSTVVADDGTTVESKVILGHPTLRALGMFPSMRPWVRPIGRLPRLRTCSAGRVEASSVISILECEPFSERNSNFTKDFIYLNLKCFILFILYLLLSSKNQSI